MIEPSRDQLIKWIWNLNMLIIRLCRALPKDHPVRQTALEYLVRENLMPSVLRKVEDNRSNDEVEPCG